VGASRCAEYHRGGVSGDGGSAGCDDFNNQVTATHGLAVSGLAGTPFNVSLGGADFNQFNLQAVSGLRRTIL
jgi:hypothetical protein